MRTREVHNPGPRKKDEAERIEIHSKNRNYPSFSASLWVHLVVISSFFPLPEFFIMFRLRRWTEKLHLMLLIFLSAAVLFFLCNSNYAIITFLLLWCARCRSLFFFYLLFVFFHRISPKLNFQHPAPSQWEEKKPPKSDGFVCPQLYRTSPDVRWRLALCYFIITELTFKSSRK